MLLKLKVSRNAEAFQISGEGMRLVFRRNPLGIMYHMEIIW